MSTARKARTATAEVLPPNAGDEWMSLNQAATALHASYHRILARAARGEFKTTTFAGRMWVSRADIERAVKAEA